MKKVILIVIMLLLSGYGFAITEGQVRINEIHYNTSGQVEYLEIKNLVGTDLSIDGLTISGPKMSYTFSGTGIKIPANGYSVIIADNNGKFNIEGYNTLGSVLTSTLYTKTGINGKVEIKFSNTISISFGVVPLDLVNVNMTMTDTHSMQRDADGNWFVAPTTLGADNSGNSTFTGKVVINEIMWDGDVEEYIEIRNLSSSSITFNNWKILGAGANTSGEVIFSGTIPANGFFLIYDDAAYVGWASSNSRTTLFLTGSGNKLGLTDTAKTLILTDNLGKTVDVVSQKSGGGWFAGVDNGKISMERYQSNIFPPGKSGDLNSVNSWYSNTALTTAGINLNYSNYAAATGGKGTPGDNNSVFVRVFDTVQTDSSQDYNETPLNILYGKMFLTPQLGALTGYISSANYRFYNVTTSSYVGAASNITDTVNWIFSSTGTVKRGQTYRAEVTLTSSSGISATYVSDNIYVRSNPTVASAVIKEKESNIAYSTVGGILWFGNNVTITASTSDLDYMMPPDVHIEMYKTSAPTLKIFDRVTSGGALSSTDIQNYLFDVGESYTINVYAIDRDEPVPEILVKSSTIYVKGFEGEYNTATTPSDTSTWALKYKKIENYINYDWVQGNANSDSGTKIGQPIGVMTDDNFGVRWRETFVAPYTGQYTFVTYSDDGVRVWIDSTQIIYQWNDHSVARHTGTISLTAGQEYVMKMEFYERGGYAVSKLFWIMPNDASGTELLFPFYENLTFTPPEGAYTAAQNVAITGVTTDAAIYYTTGSGVLTTATGVQYTHGSTINISATSTIRAMYIKNGVQSPEYSATYIIGTIARSGMYYNGRNFNTFVYSREDKNINFNWGNGSPNDATHTGVNADQFSVRWIMNFTAPVTGTYIFRSQSDDGVRVYVNNSLIINNWTDHSSTSNTGTINLTTGQACVMKMEYYENTGQAVAQLFWTIPGLTSEVLFPEMPLNVAAYKDSTMNDEISDSVWSNTGGDGKIFVKFTDAPSAGTYKYRYTLRDETNAVVTSATITTTKSTLTVVDNKYSLFVELLSSSNVVLMTRTLGLWIDDTAPTVTIDNYQYDDDVGGAGYKVTSTGILWTNGGTGHNRLMSTFLGNDTRSGISTYVLSIFKSGSVSPVYSETIAVAGPINTSSWAAILVSPQVLENGEEYIHRIAAIDRAGNVTAGFTYSTGVRVDTKAPTGTIYDIRNANNNIDIFGTTVQADWVNGGAGHDTLRYTFTASDTGSGVDTSSYYYSAYKNMTTMVTAITNVTLASGDRKIDSGTLDDGPDNRYNQWITLSDRVGNSVTITSAGVFVDKTLPAAAGVNLTNQWVGQPVDSVWSNGGAGGDMLNFSFSEAATDTQSGIWRYEYGLGTSPGSDNLIAFRTTSGGVNITASGILLEESKTYYHILRIWDKAGNFITTYAAVTIDKTPPIVNSIEFFENGAFLTMISDKRFTVQNDFVPDIPSAGVTKAAIDVRFATSFSDPPSGINNLYSNINSVQFIPGASGVNFAGFTWDPIMRGGAVLFPTVIFRVFDNAGNSIDRTYTNISFDETSFARPKIVDVEIDSYNKKKKMIYIESATGSGVYIKRYKESNER